MLVAPQLLDPLQVDHRHHANAQIRVLGDVVLRRHHGAVQALIKQDIGALWQLFPRGEGAGLLLKGLGLFGVVQVFAGPACPLLRIVAKQVFNVAKEVVLRPKVAEMVVAFFLRLDQTFLHLLAVVAVKAVALDDGGFDALAAEDVLKGAGNRGGSGAG